MSGDIQLVSPALIEAVRERARLSPRKRSNHNFHSSAQDAVHRFLNVLTRGTYVQPHRHIDPPKHESFIVLEGSVLVVTFEDDGRVCERYVLSAGADGVRGIDLPAGVWHTIAALTDDAVCFEVKPGPWDPATDKDFASWAPSEAEPEAAQAYLERLLSTSSA